MFTTITTTANVPMKYGQRITIHEPDGGRTVYTVREWLSDHKETRQEFQDGKLRVREVIVSSTYSAVVERFEPIWKTKERIRRAVREEDARGLLMAAA